MCTACIKLLRVRLPDFKCVWTPCQISMFDVLSEGECAKRIRKKPAYGGYVRARGDCLCEHTVFSGV